MLKIYKKLSVLYNYIKNLGFKNKTYQQNPYNISDKITQHSGSLLFLLDNSDILILINIPDTSSKTPEEIVNLAESYANFVIQITNSTMYENILDLLEKKISDEQSISNKLFIENVLHFAPILKNELEKHILSSYINNTEPLVRPINVFKYNAK